MKITMKDGQVILSDIGAYFSVLRSWGLLAYHKQTQTLRGTASIDLLDKLAQIMRLPPEVEAQRNRLRAIMEAVDAERGAEHPVPLAHYPVKVKLFEHQVRGCNLALLTFGVIPPEAVKERTQ